MFICGAVPVLSLPKFIPGRHQSTFFKKKIMAIKAKINWEVFNRSTNERVEGVSHVTMVNDYTEIQPKALQKLSQKYGAKALEKDLKFQNKLGPGKEKGGYVISEITDDSKTHDIVIRCSIISHG